MDIGKPLVSYGAVDISDLVQKICALAPEFWNIDLQNRAHLASGRPGNAVFYFNDSPVFAHRSLQLELQSGLVNVLRYVERPLFDEIMAVIEGGISKHFPDCNVMRVQLAQLPPGAVIKPHKDKGVLTKVHRLHVPLVSDRNVRFIIEDECFCLVVGQLYDLNNTVTHAVENNSDIMRTHLLVDMLPRGFAKIAYHDSEPQMLEAVVRMMICGPGNA